MEDTVNKNYSWLSVMTVTSVVLLFSTVMVYTAHVFAAPQSQESKKTTSKAELQEMAEAKYGKENVKHFEVQAAAPGRAVTGVVIHEASDHSELALDTHPCESQVEVFTAPYDTKDTKETVKCNGKTLRKIRVTQK
jgi:hypothetical protein